MVIGNNIENKTHVFLYPFAEAMYNPTFFPENIYSYWNGEEDIENFQIMAYYKHDKNNILYKNFEKELISRDKNLIRCYRIPEGTVYVYDLIESADEVFNFLNGYYSKFTDKSKFKIMRYNNISTAINTDRDNPIHIYLYPQKYYIKAAKELNLESIKSLKGTELGKIFKKNEETLNVKSFENCNCKEEKIIFY